MSGPASTGLDEGAGAAQVEAASVDTTRGVLPDRGSHATFGSRFLFHGCRLRQEKPSWSPARLFRGRAVTSCHVFVRPPCANAPRRAGPRLPDVCDRSPRALLRGVPRKGSINRLAASSQAPRLADRARPRRSTEVRCGRSAALERGRRFAARSGSTGSGGSPSIDEGGGGDDARPSSAPTRRVVVELRADQEAQGVRQYGRSPSRYCSPRRRSAPRAVVRREAGAEASD
jgi:hypothetical protein